MFLNVGRTPFAFVTFGRCTPAHGRGALPSFPSVIPAECKPLRGLVRVISYVQRVRLLSALLFQQPVALQRCLIL